MKKNADASRFDLISHNPEQTQKIGFAIGESAQAGDLVLLVGDLGAGKTCLTQGIARGLGLTDHTSSPSFVLVKEYPGRLYLYHIDLYRLDNIAEIEELGLDEYLYGNGICVIEWADKALNSLPEEHVLIRIEHMAENERQFLFEAKGQRHIDLLAQLKERWNSQ